jgi:hypothetical protein
MTDTARLDAGPGGDAVMAYLEFFRKVYMDAGIGGTAALLFVAAFAALLAVFARHGFDPFLNVYDRLGLGRGGRLTVDPHEHVIFKRLASMRDQLGAIKVRCPLRDLVGKEMQRIRLNAIITELRRYVKADHLADPPRELRAGLHDMTDAMDAKFRKGCAEAGVPACAVDSYERRTRAYADIWDRHIGTICESSRLYDTPAKRIYAAFDAMDALEEARRVDLPEALAALNGELSASEFLGVRCRNCPECRADESIRKKG